MSQGTVMIQNRLQEKDFTVATPEEFVKRFNGTKVINKVRSYLCCFSHHNTIFIDLEFVTLSLLISFMKIMENFLFLNTNIKELIF